MAATSSARRSCVSSIGSSGAPGSDHDVPHRPAPCASTSGDDVCACITGLAASRATYRDRARRRPADASATAPSLPPSSCACASGGGIEDTRTPSPQRIFSTPPRVRDHPHSPYVLHLRGRSVLHRRLGIALARVVCVSTYPQPTHPPSRRRGLRASSSGAPRASSCCCCATCPRRPAARCAAALV